MAYSVFETEPIGVNGEYESTAVHPCCNESCAWEYLIREDTEGNLQVAENDSIQVEGLHCENCGKVIA